MPTYCFETDDGTIVERYFPVGKAEKTILIDGKTARRSFRHESKGFPAKSGWPLECVASGVSAGQRQDLSDHLRKAGVPTQISGDGNPIYRDPAHRKAALKARGLHDRNSFN